MTDAPEAIPSPREPRHLRVLPGDHNAQDWHGEADAASLVYAEMLRARGLLKKRLVECPDHPSIPRLVRDVADLEKALTAPDVPPAPEVTALAEAAGTEHRDGSRRVYVAGDLRAALVGVLARRNASRDGAK